VFDFGLGGLFERFDKAFGERLTWLLTVLIGLTVAVSCISLTLSLISPAYVFIKSAVFETTARQSLFDFLVLVFAIVVGVVSAAWVASALEFRRKIDAARYRIRELEDELSVHEAASLERQKLVDFLDAESLRLERKLQELHAEYNKIKEEVAKLELRAGNAKD
jgi:hypothetical protein